MSVSISKPISQKLRCNGRFAITLLLTAGSEPRLEREARKFDCPAPTRPPTLRFPSLQRPTQRQRIWLDWDELSVMSAAWSAGKRSCPDIICYLLSVVWEGEAARNNVVICPRVSVAVPTLSVICYLLSVVWEGEAARNNVVTCPRVSVAVPTSSVIWDEPILSIKNAFDIPNCEGGDGPTRAGGQHLCRAVLRASRQICSASTPARPRGGVVPAASERTTSCGKARARASNAGCRRRYMFLIVVVVARAERIFSGECRTRR